MKITKGQTALIVLVIGVLITIVTGILFVKNHPFIAVPFIGGLITTLVGYLMYQRNK